MKTLLFLPLTLVLLFLVTFTSQQRVGYIGPACAVSEDALFLHGEFKRKLSADEVHAFYRYQGALLVHKQLQEALAMGAASVSQDSNLLFGPQIPTFCNGLDDSVEVVLHSCNVRNNNVYVADRLVRSLNAAEKQKIDTLMAAVAVNMMDKKRRNKRRNEANSEEEAGGSYRSGAAQNDVAVAELLSHFFNVNSSVAERFVPMARQSPLLERLNDSILKALNSNKRTNNNNNNEGEGKNVGNGEQRTRRRNGADEANVMPLADDSAATNIPHMIIPDESSPKNVVPSGVLNLNDPLIQQLLRSLAAQQQSVEQLRPPQQQQFATPGFPPPLQQPAAGKGIQPGETITIGGQTYVAVPLSALSQQQSPNVPLMGVMPTTSPIAPMHQFEPQAAYTNQNAGPQWTQQPHGAAAPGQALAAQPVSPALFASTTTTAGFSSQSVPVGYAAAPEIPQNSGQQEKMNNIIDLPNEICTADEPV